MGQRSGGNMGSMIAGIILVFFGFIIVIVLVAQASVVNAITGELTLANASVFFGVIFLSLLSVLLGGYVVGKYAEKIRMEKQKT